MDIDDWRRGIDEIDAQLVKLLNQRGRCAIEIGKLKRALKMEIYSPEREKEVLQNVRRLNNGPLGGDAIQRLFERIIDESRRLERLTVGGDEAGDVPSLPVELDD